jgi:uncharacterized C2H2 Zn-finger protein
MFEIKCPRCDGFKIRNHKDVTEVTMDHDCSEYGHIVGFNYNWGDEPTTLVYEGDIDELTGEYFDYCPACGWKLCKM